MPESEVLNCWLLPQEAELCNAVKVNPGLSVSEGESKKGLMHFRIEFTRAESCYLSTDYAYLSDVFFIVLFLLLFFILHV